MNEPLDPRFEPGNDPEWIDAQVKDLLSEIWARETEGYPVRPFTEGEQLGCCQTPQPREEGEPMRAFRLVPVTTRRFRLDRLDPETVREHRRYQMEWK